MDMLSTMYYVYIPNERVKNIVVLMLGQINQITKNIIRLIILLIKT